MNKMKECEIVRDAINLVEHGQYLFNKELIQQCREKGFFTYEGFQFHEEFYAWIVVKPSDDEFGEPLMKVVPKFMEVDKISQLLNAQQWLRW